MVVTFCGHREIHNTEELKEKLHCKLEHLIAQGTDEFLLGGYGEFDRLCAVMLNGFKAKYPQIKNILILPYPDKKYDTALYDYSEYPDLENTPKRYAILKRNE